MSRLSANAAWLAKFWAGAVGVAFSLNYLWLWYLAAGNGYYLPRLSVNSLGEFWIEVAVFASAIPAFLWLGTSPRPAIASRPGPRTTGPLTPRRFGSVESGPRLRSPRHPLTGAHR
jgi:hypothetical protein